MKKLFKVNNFTKLIPDFVSNNELALSTRLIAKHYLDEQAEDSNCIEKIIEQIRFRNRLQNSNYFKYKPQIYAAFH